MIGPDGRIDEPGSQAILVGVLAALADATRDEAQPSNPPIT